MITAGKIRWFSDKVPNDKGMALETVTSFNCNIYIFNIYYAAYHRSLSNASHFLIYNYVVLLCPLPPLAVTQFHVHLFERRVGEVKIRNQGSGVSGCGRWFPIVFRHSL
jgi:hypothetical protein